LCCIYFQGIIKEDDGTVFLVDNSPNRGIIQGKTR